MNEIAFGMTFLQLARLGMDKAEARSTGVKVDARKKVDRKIAALFIANSVARFIQTFRICQGDKGTD